MKVMICTIHIQFMYYCFYNIWSFIGLNFKFCFNIESIIDYSRPPAYKARTQLTAIDHQEHKDRPYAKDKNGEMK